MENQDTTWCWSSETLNGIASWFGASLASAFFASLDRWSCINVSTYDDPDSDDDDASTLSNTVSINLRNQTPAAAAPPPADKNDVANLPV